MRDVTFHISESTCKCFISVEKLPKSVQVHVAINEALVCCECKIC